MISEKGGIILKIIIIEADGNCDISDYMKYISAERRERAARIRSDRDRILSVTAELAVRREIITELGMKNQDISFDYGEHGKPFLHGRSDFHFSFSHSGKYIALVCSRENAGIDIEKKSRGNEKIARRYFTGEEYSRIYGNTGQNLSFAEVWTSKEAYIKFTGEGLSRGLNTFSVLESSTGCRFERFDLDEYTVTVCTESEDEIYCEIINAEKIYEFFRNI